MVHLTILAEIRPMLKANSLESGARAANRENPG
jgi:hypothetical protein